jgi:chromosome segregation ATPase
MSETYYNKIRDTFLDHNDVSEDVLLKGTLDDETVTGLILDMMRDNLRIKKHYAAETMNSVEKLSKLGRRVDQNEQELRKQYELAYETVVKQKDASVASLNMKLLNTMKEINNLKSSVGPELEKTSRLEQLVKEFKMEREDLMSKLGSAEKEIESYKVMKNKAAAQFNNMKEDFMTLQKDALQVKTNLSEAVDKIKELQTNGVATKDATPLVCSSLILSTASDRLVLTCKASFCKVMKSSFILLN